MKRSVLNYIVDIGLVITFIVSFSTAIIKFPGFLQKIGVNYTSLPLYEISVIHDWSGIAMGGLVMVHVMLHWKWIVTMTKKVGFPYKKAVVPIIVIAVIVLVAIFRPAEPQSAPLKEEITLPETPEESTIYGEIHDTDVSLPGQVMIDGVGEFDFDPKKVESVRKDIFKDGHFSVFAILVHLDHQEKIDMKYHFDEDMDTYVIDSINGERNWWYTAYYSGGWPEKNVYRMDYYPYKDKMYIRIRKVNNQKIESIYKKFREEVERKTNGKMIIPLVIIRGVHTKLQFENVEVIAHNLRSDVFQEGVITAIDVILSLGDQGLITYDLQWYDSIGTAEIVRSYWVNRINEDESYGRCGFVYEAGSLEYQRFRGNHIHIPADTRMITFPEYVEFFWICL